MQISVVLCTHNPRPRYFAQCLEALRLQDLPVDQWEMLLIDNLSDEPIAGRFDISWQPRGRILREETLGLTPARLRGIREAEGDLLVFVDDDNVVDANFLSVAQRIAKEKPFLGSWSGQCRPKFETPPPEWTRRYWGSLVIREFEVDAWSNLPRFAGTMPCGAGMCVRRAVAQHYLLLHRSGKRSFQLDRTGSALLSGGDNDLASCACDLGFGVGLMRDLKLVHMIPPERLHVDYLARLIEGIYFSGAVLDNYRKVPEERESLVRRVLFWLQLPFLRYEDGKIALAAKRGRREARTLVKRVARHEKSH